MRLLKSKTAALLVLPASMVVLVIGMLRLVDYSGLVVVGRYEQAGQHKWEERFEDQQQSLPMTGLDDNWSTWTDAQFCRATDTVVGDRVAAKFNHGLTLYRDNNYSGAVAALQRAYSACHNQDGSVKIGRRKMASEIQLLIGNAFANLSKIEEAKSAYVQSLTLDPTNTVTIYNLERLQSGGGKGGEGGQGDQPSRPRSDDI